MDYFTKSHFKICLLLLLKSIESLKILKELSLLIGNTLKSILSKF